MFFSSRRNLSRNDIIKLSSKINELKKTFLSLSAGAIVLSFTFLQITKNVKYIWLIKIGWFFFIVTILSILISQIIELRQDSLWEIIHNKWPPEKKLDELPDDDKNTVKNNLHNYFVVNKYLIILDYIIAGSFLLGIVFLLLFILNNS